jgi:UDP-N-acetylglucosamine 4,6-dehydratase/5-epimerase
MNTLFKDKTVLITGGTGSFGKAITKELILKHDTQKIIIYSRDELKQYEMAQSLLLKSASKDNRMRYFIGDVRDKDRLNRAMNGVDIVIHAAALKQVPAAEYNPFECIKTNVIGAQNVIDAAIDSGVDRVIALSTDKAAAPVNLYGASKLCSDKLFIAGNNYRGSKSIKLSVVRYGNVMGSRGSVIPKFIEMKKTGKLTITDKRMTRFNITLNEAVAFTIYCINEMQGEEVFVPKIPSYKIMDLAEAVDENCKCEYIGLRPGEKLHEEMITTTDSYSSLEFASYYMILPTTKFKNLNGCSTSPDFIGVVKNGYRYNSETNNIFLTVEELKELIKENIL